MSISDIHGLNTGHLFHVKADTDKVEPQEKHCAGQLREVKGAPRGSTYEKRILNDIQIFKSR